MDDEIDASLPSVPQDRLQIPEKKAKIRRLGWNSVAANNALSCRPRHRCHQWNLQEKLQYRAFTQVSFPSYLNIMQSSH